MTVVKTCAKIGIKVALNTTVPGLGTLVDFGEALKDVYEGNYTGAFYNTAMGVFDLVSLGAASSVKDVAKETGKNAAKESKKVASKTICHEVAQPIAEDESEKIFIEIVAEMEIHSNLAKEISRDMIENAFKQSLTTATTKEAAIGFIGRSG